MAKIMYAAALAEDESFARASEHQGLKRLTGMLDAAIHFGPDSREAIDALASFNAVWSSLLEDLASSENYLPDDIRARLISIGIFLLKESDAIQKGKSSNFRALRDITSTIAEGMA